MKALPALYCYKNIVFIWFTGLYPYHTHTHLHKCTSRTSHTVCVGVGRESFCNLVVGLSIHSESIMLFCSSKNVSMVILKPLKYCLNVSSLIKIMLIFIFLLLIFHSMFYKLPLQLLLLSKILNLCRTREKRNRRW